MFVGGSGVGADADHGVSLGTAWLCADRKLCAYADRDDHGRLRPLVRNRTREQRIRGRVPGGERSEKMAAGSFLRSRGGTAGGTMDARAAGWRGDRRNSG